MGNREEVGRVFEGAGGVPEAFQLSETVEQRSYLIGGMLRTWEGRIEDVLSPICEETANEPVPRRIGSYPVLTEKEAMAALDAAEGAYANGRGA